MPYPLVLTLIDGKNETLFSVRDFEYLMEKYMGYEAVKFSGLWKEGPMNLPKNRARPLLS